PDQDRQNLQEGAPFASRFIPHFAVGFGDLGELQISQVTVEPCLEIVITPCHESPRQWCYRNGRKPPDRPAPARCHRSARAAVESAEWVWEAGGAGVPPAEGSRRRPRRRPQTPGPWRLPKPPRWNRRLAPDLANDAGEHRSSTAGVSSRGGTGVPRDPRRQTPVPARCSATAGSWSPLPGGVPAPRSVPVA